MDNQNNNKILLLIFILLFFLVIQSIVIIESYSITIGEEEVTLSNSYKSIPRQSLENRIETLEKKVQVLNKLRALALTHKIVEIFVGIFTIIAIFGSGIWGYKLFIQNRQKYPWANISNEISNKQITPDKNLIHVKVNISNKGNILISVIFYETRISQILPVTEKIFDAISNEEKLDDFNDTEIDWDLIDTHEVTVIKGDIEIEPGEAHEIHHDFLVDSRIETIGVYSYVKNEKKKERDIGWNTTTLYDVKQNQVLNDEMRGKNVARK